MEARKKISLFILVWMLFLLVIILANYKKGYLYAVLSNDKKEYQYSSSNYITPALQKTNIAGYTKLIDREKYEIFKANSSDNVIRAVLRDISVVYKKGTICISTNGIIGPYRYSVSFDNKNFPNLIPNSSIEYFMLLPWTRNMTKTQTGYNWRLVVITTRGQIYHNYPSRAIGSDGNELEGDILRFDESVIWDLPERKYPSKELTAAGSERYFPGLPDDVYRYYPLLNTAVNFVDIYGNGGFGRSIIKTEKNSTEILPRFYMPKRDKNWCSFSPMGGYEPDDKLTILGTYQSNIYEGEGGRIGIFVTDDGGRSWYLKYEFTDEGRELNWCNTINTSQIVNNYTNDSFVIKKRDLVVPSGKNKQPSDKFIWGTPIAISSISKSNPAIVSTVTPHNLTSGNIVIFQHRNANYAAISEWDWITNDSVNSTSGGNGMMFKVEVIDSTSFKLHEFVHSSYNNISCRHIHYINRIKDGWLIGTGEIYPNGWELYAQMKGADTYTIVRASDDLPILRLNSSEESVQRLLGSIMMDDTDSTMIVVASDEARMPRDNIIMPSGRTETKSRSSTGIFRGKLSDIDDMSKFTPIFEAKQPAFFFKEKAGAWVFCGARGEFAISFDKGQTWSVEDVGFEMSHFYGESNKYIVVDNFVIKLK